MCNSKLKIEKIIQYTIAKATFQYMWLLEVILKWWCLAVRREKKLGFRKLGEMGSERDGPATPMAMPSKTEWKHNASMRSNASPRFDDAKIAALFSGTATLKDTPTSKSHLLQLQSITSLSQLPKLMNSLIWDHQLKAYNGLSRGSEHLSWFKEGGIHVTHILQAVLDELQTKAQLQCCQHSMENHRNFHVSIDYKALMEQLKTEAEIQCHQVLMAKPRKLKFTCSNWSQKPKRGVAEFHGKEE